MIRKPVLVAVGLDDGTEHVESLISEWDSELFDVQVSAFGWQDRSISTEQACQQYLQKIRATHKRAGKVCLVGVSAGGAASIWGAEELPEMVDSVIDVCGAIRLPRETWITRRFGSPGERFDEVLQDIQHISPTTLRKLTILRPTLLDGLVRMSSFEVEGALIEVVPRITHQIAINYAMRRVVPKMI